MLPSFPASATSSDLTEIGARLRSADARHGVPLVMLPSAEEWLAKGSRSHDRSYRLTPRLAVALIERSAGAGCHADCDWGG
jgi:hypothetical protein